MPTSGKCDCRITVITRGGWEEGVGLISSGLKGGHKKYSGMGFLVGTPRTSYKNMNKQNKNKMPLQGRMTPSGGGTTQSCASTDELIICLTRYEDDSEISCQQSSQLQQMSSRK